MARYREGQDMEQDEERRKHAGFTDEQVRVIKEAILASVYEDIGRSLVKKVLWVGGALLTGLLGWLAAKGYITVRID